MIRNHRYWREEDRLAVTVADSFGELTQIALAVVGRMPPPVGQVCGPISTGGVGSIEQNLMIFEAAIDQLLAQGLTIFDQTPFEQHIFRILEDGLGTRQRNQLLEQFYRPIFQSRCVHVLYFIPGWQFSNGAQWEHQLGRSLKLDIVYL